MLDLHCHILPGLDDGARNLDEAVQMARIAEKQSVSGIVATPHFLEGSSPPSAESVLQACASLRDALHCAGVSVDIYPGMEVYICPQLDVLVRTGEVLTINNQGRHLLLELPFDSIPSYCEQVLFALLMDSITPILAHPERYDNLTVEMLAHWVERGLLVQANSGSFSGFFGPRAQKKAERLLLGNMVHVVASDGHSAGQRAPVLTKAQLRVAALMGAETVRDLFFLNPQKVVRGEHVEVKPLRPVAGLTLWRRRLQSRLQGMTREA